ncbi:hypothetical protein [Paenibacillus aquistagni]|uniref:hypothetical protein n=1 Tax=Paenibacillus aquistagni TaxID=1852522 RepID=UPI00145B0459|nr:hypothetical protein [Paenibacillus aquistagni]NMM54155.1 hypothetical protein [Paenibacillus aquistagni]
MNLADMLSYADIQQLARIAQQYECECNINSKHELIQSILLELGRKELFEQHVSKMSIEETRFLNSLLFDQQGFFSIEELIARVQQARFDSDPNSSQVFNPRDTILKFKHSGWLFNGCTQQTKYLLHIPSDLKLRFRDVLHRRFKEQLHVVSSPEAYRDEDGRLGEDIIFLLRYIDQEMVQLSSEGVMYKRSQQQLLEQLAVREPVIAKGEWRFGYGRRFHNYPDRLSLIYDYAFYRGWIEEGNGCLSLTAAGEERLTQGAAYEALQPVYRFWLKLYKNAIPNLLSLVHWIQRCTEKWTTTESLQQTLVPYVRPFYYDTPESILGQRILKMMIHLGLLRYGEDPEYGASVLITKRGQTLIQDIYVPHEEKISLVVDKP